MRTIGWFLLLYGLLFSGLRGAYRIYADWDYAKTVEYNWTLADKASTISQKSEYINNYVATLEAQDLYGVYANLWLNTESTLFDENLKAVKSLQNRLIAISDMDENSFAYQTALQQITAQEQGEAENMLDCIKSCWMRVNYYTLWSPLFFWGFLLLQIGAIFVGWIMISEN